MWRGIVVVACVIGWLVLAGGALAPVGGMILAATDTARVSTEVVAVPPPGQLFIRSITLSAVATGAAVLLGIAPAAVLASLGYAPRRSRWRSRAAAAVVWGLVLAPLMVPPQVYAYAWGLVTMPQGIFGGVVQPLSGPHWLGGAVRAGLISAGWLWPVVAMILAAGWRMSGRSVLTLAILDTTPTRAFFRAVLPSLRAHLVAASCLVFAITLLEYPIPHLSLARVYATELMVLMDVHASFGQVMQMAGPVIALVLVVLGVGAWSLRGVSSWGAVDWEAESITSLPGNASNLWAALLPAGMAWLASLGLPVWVMLRQLRTFCNWRDGFFLFSRDWADSLGVAAAAAVAAMLVAMGTVVLAEAASSRAARKRPLPRLARAASAVSLIGALVPPTALGVGLIVVFNRAGVLGWLYTETPLVWVLALAARYAPIVVLVTWLAVRRRSCGAAEQAETDGAGPVEIAGWVLLPLVWPALLAGGVMVALLSLFEVVATQLVRPVGFQSIALALLNQMHYGRDDVVITTSLLIVAAGVVLTQVCAWLLMPRRS